MNILLDLLLSTASTLQSEKLQILVRLDYNIANFM